MGKYAGWPEECIPDNPNIKDESEWGWCEKCQFFVCDCETCWLCKGKAEMIEGVFYEKR